MPRDSGRLELVVADTGEVVPVPDCGHERLEVLIAGAHKALKDAGSFVQVKEIRDRAEAWRIYVKSINGSAEAQNRCAELKVRAERRMGDELAKAPLHEGGRPAGNQSHDATSFRLKDIGVTKSESSRWQAMAQVPPKEFEDYVAKAKEITSSGVQKLARKQKRRQMMQRQADSPGGRIECLQQLIAEGCKFGTIYADPPWKYDNQATRASTDNHYRTMTVEDICALPVKQLAADDAHLHMWITDAFLPHFTTIFAAWGFEFRKSFVWVKPQMGIGNYWRSAHELLLTGVRGDAKRFGDTELMSWIEVDRGKHSGKPEQVRAMIERASPPPRLELFSRNKVEGWTTWGDDAEPNLLTHYLSEVA